jgi:coenzyme F420-reducing hydrogenase beta subunit
MNNISKIHDCYGCGICATACGRKIIEIGLNAEGFYEPHITDPNKCTNCGICTEVCAYLHEDLSLQNQEIHPYAAWSKDYLVRRKCSSGGAGFEIGKYLLGQGYKVCGVRYNADKNRAEHYIATNVEELIPSAGSKYIQSYTVDGFKAINRKEKYLVTGSPCQIDSFRRYIRKFRCEDNFVLLDFFCHGVPSMLVWKKYTEWAEKQVGKITYASWRNKWTGWHDSWAMGIDGEEHGEKINWHDSYDMLIRGKKSYIESRLSQGDMFYQLFLGDCCLGKQCYDHCKYKYNHSSADIRIGDLWGKTYNDDEDGVSGAVAFTQKGNEVLKQCNCELVEHSFDVVAEGQMKTCPQRIGAYNKILETLKNDSKNIQDACHILTTYRKQQRQLERIKHPVRSFKNIIKKIVK